MSPSWRWKKDWNPCLMKISRKFIFVFCIFLIFGFKFPEDHTFHSDFQTEWVYFVGEIVSEQNETFGFELSFFRGKLGNLEFYPVHFAISIPRTSQHLQFQTIQRPFGKMSGHKKTEIWSGEYRLKIKSSNQFELIANPKNSQIKLQLNLQTVFKPILHGDNGHSKKSRIDTSIYSNYYSLPRLDVKGNLYLNGKESKILRGIAWMDHEWSHPLGETGVSKLSSRESSWDWLFLNSSDGSDFVFYQFRKDSDSPRECFGTWRKPNGDTKHFEKEGEVKMEPVGDAWVSPRTKKAYPLKWKILFPDGYFEVEPVFESQEFDGRESTGIVYWEGMTRGKGRIEGKLVQGNGYLELKGR